METVISVPDKQHVANTEDLCSEPKGFCARLKPHVGRLITAGIFIAFAAGLVVLMIERRKDLVRFLEWIHSIGIWGNVCIVVLFVVISFPIPLGYSFLGLASGFLYNLWFGTLTMVLGASILGAPLSFIIMGRFFQSWSEHKMATWPKFRVFLFAIRQHGFKIAFLMRLTPLPFGFQNTMFSVSGIGFWPYALGTALGLLPEQFAWVYFGSTCKKLTQIVANDVPMNHVEKIMIAVETVAVVLVVAVVSFLAKRAMAKATTEYEASTAGRAADEEAATERQRLVDDFDDRSGASTSGAPPDEPPAGVFSASTPYNGIN
eukprot:TRINITY_DN7732_c0_g1_i1.p1 TRINITY_DN7732_c0_g1~~TRINITY_DN7732_c0_g1_i1.p1  ORF type:complete len:318 (-),score=73.97 TRINITY_DN7732_c0_g1_i1:604-1557(-)